MSLLSPPRRPLLMPAWSRNDLWRRAAAVPSLDLNFAATKNIGPLVTFTRASTATFIDSAGVLQTAATDVPRFDHNPATLESLGLLVEESRTNSIRNNTMAGAAAGTPGTVPTNWSDLPTSNGLSRQIVGVGTQAGISYIDIRYSGTASATASTIIQPELSSVTVAATGQSWTANSWLALAAGSTSGLTIIQRVTGRSSVGGFLENTDTTVALSSTLTRYSASITMANASTARVSSDIALSYTSGAAIDITLRIGLPQLEQGAFATSVIPTTTAAATRSADVASITGTNFSSWYRQDEGTVFASVVSAPNNTIAQLATDISDASGNERMFVRRTGAGSLAIAVIDGSVTQADVGAGPVIPGGASYAIAASYRLNSINLATGGQLGTEDTSATIPTPDRMFIGQNFGSTQHANGTIRRLTYWPQRLANSVLQTITL